MREIVTVHVGSPGVAVGNKVWELLNIEHFVEPSRGTSTQDQSLVQSNLSAFYDEFEGSYTPRALFIDNLSEFSSNLTFPESSTLRPDQIIQTSDSLKNFTTGYESLGLLHNDQIQESIRKLTEPCSTFQGFIIYNSISGGLSGLSSKIIENFSDFYSKSTKLGLTLFPSSTSDELSILNSVLSFNSYLSKLDSCIYIENEAIQRIYNKVLNINSVTNNDINMIIASLVSQITSPLRFEAGTEMSLIDFVYDYVPYPEIKYLVASMAPILNVNSREQDKISTFTACFSTCSHDYLFSDTNLQQGKLMSGDIFYRGNIVPNDMGFAVNELKEKKMAPFIDWSRDKLHTKISRVDVGGFRDSLFLKVDKEFSLLCNTTAIQRNFSGIMEKFDRAWERGFRVDGMDEAGLLQGREGLENLVQDYCEVGSEF